MHVETLDDKKGVAILIEFTQNFSDTAFQVDEELIERWTYGFVWCPRTYAV